MGEWSFCEKCGWHSTGKATACPNCASGDVRRFDDDLLMDAKGEFHSSREAKEKMPPVDAAKEKAKSA
jgi:hypothetical protein